MISAFKTTKGSNARGVVGKIKGSIKRWKEGEGVWGCSPIEIWVVAND